MTSAFESKILCRIATIQIRIRTIDVAYQTDVRDKKEIIIIDFYLQIIAHWVLINYFNDLHFNYTDYSKYINTKIKKISDKSDNKEYYNYFMTKFSDRKVYVKNQSENRSVITIDLRKDNNESFFYPYLDDKMMDEMIKLFEDMKVR